ncbi:16S rRNA (uracil(1498)-N(3))-methyltransferase [Marinimicrobium agarilyticum]|uniref:16S rRNA (uracil(1498)-N(3))-methyltransferase n=1 Tax=Marinimicrobium agarilyticum TaxID=306546 RepID=UPI000412EEA6|nr:16S rRNA (uracil(1498)-N(3))-methyltransferase [Marinimicrobium agarilyticum]
MNLLLLKDQELIAPGLARVTDKRRIEHITRVLKAGIGDTLTVGEINGNLGQGLIEHLDNHELRLALTLNQTPPSPMPLTLILALPRPQQIKRILQTVASAGVKTLHLIHSRRVEKSYWQSPALAPEEVERQLHLGLEQGRDTVEPRVHFHPRFKPFVEDELPVLMTERLALVAHPYHAAPCPSQVQQAVIMAVGPEGGFNDFEIEQLSTRGFQTVHLGERILKTETAIPFLLGRLF